MKIGITNIFNSCIINPDLMTGFDLTYFAKFINGFYPNAVDILGSAKNTNKNQYYRNILDCDLNQYDVIIIQPNKTINIFGGKAVTELTDFLLTEIPTSYKGKIGWFVNDPANQNGANNPITQLKKEHGSKELVKKYLHLEEKWDNALQNAFYMYPGRNIDKFWSGFKFTKDIIFEDYFSGMFYFYRKANVLPIEEKPFNVVYYGYYRTTYRKKQILKYLNDSENNLLISNKKINEFSKVKYVEKIAGLQDLSRHLQSCKVSLIIGDEPHNNNIVTWRFYESLLNDCLLAISNEYDYDKLLIEDEYLKGILYVKNSNDVENLSKIWTKELVDTQKSHLMKIFSRDRIANICDNIIKKLENLGV